MGNDGELKSVNACEKLLFQELQVWPTLTPLRDRQPPGAQLEISKPLCSGNIMFPGKDRRRRGTADHPGQECCSLFLNLIFPEFQNPSPHFVLGYVRQSVRVQTHCPLRSQTI